MKSAERQRLERWLNEEIEHYFREIRMRDHEEAALKSVCHTLVWARGLDEQLEKELGQPYKDFRDNDPAGEHVKGTKFARNRGVHQFVELLSIDRGVAYFPLLFPAPFFEIVWRPSSALPPPDPDYAKSNAKVQPAYDNALAGKPVRFTWEWLQEFFKRAPE